MEAEEGKDVLSNLPDDIIWHILSFLKLKDILRLRILSRRFRTVSIATPSLSFFEVGADGDCSCTHVSDFMNTLPHHRPHALKINQLYFSSSHCTNLEHRTLLEHWMKQLSQTFRVDELHLRYTLPSLFTSLLPRFQSLTLLKVRMTAGSDLLVKLPQNMKLASLHTLYLRHIYTDDLVGNWVSQSFPSLKRFYLINECFSINHSRQDLTIQSSSLENLTIIDCVTFTPVRIIANNLRAFEYKVLDLSYYHEVRSGPQMLVVDISVPNLERLCWKGDPTRLLYDKGTLKNLRVADFKPTWRLASEHANSNLQLLQAIRWTPILHTDFRMLEKLYKKSMAISFENVRHMGMEVDKSRELNYNKEFCEAVISFFERIPNLETLTILNHPRRKKVSYGRYNFKHALEVCRKTKMKEIKGMKKVKFVIRVLDQEMILLIGALTKWCRDLQEMTIYYPCLPRKIMKTYLKRLNCYSKLSVKICALFN